MKILTLALLFFFSIYNSQVFAQNNSLIKAAKKGNLEKVIEIVEKGIDINYINTESKHYPATALQISAKKGYVEIVKYLIKAGANINLESGRGYTALDYACIYGNLKMIKLLVNNGAEINHQNHYGITPLMSVSIRDYNSTLFLIENGAIVEYISKPIIDTWETTALIYAAPYCNSKILKLLVDNGADINYKDNHSKTALDYAASIKRLCPENYNFLIKKGAKTGNEIGK